jgi:hypothetical protein
MRKPTLTLTALLIAIATCMHIGCTSSDNKGQSKKCNELSEATVDTQLMAYLSATRALHHEADLLEDRGDFVGAIRLMDRLEALRAPNAAAEVQEARADAFARKAEFQIAAKDFPGASTAIARGLELVTGDNYYRGHLLEIRGRLAKAQLRALSSQDGPEAVALRKQAIDSMEEAIGIQSRVIAKLGPASTASSAVPTSTGTVP